jgi:hypothetical protein
MTDTTLTPASDQSLASAPAAPAPEQADIHLPDDVSALLDEATAAGHGIVLDPTATSIRSVDHTGATVREVQWAEAGAWSLRVFRGVSQAVAAGQQAQEKSSAGWPEEGERP